MEETDKNGAFSMDQLMDVRKCRNFSASQSMQSGNIA